MTGYSYFVSSLMASRVGAFDAFEINRTHFLKVIRNHARCATALGGDFEGLGYTPFVVNDELLRQMGKTEILDNLKDVWTHALAGIEEHGARNAQVSVIAPTGTISFAMDCGSTSVEPYYSHVVYKTLAGGGSMEIVNPVIEQTLLNLGYTTRDFEKVTEFLLAKDEKGYSINFSLLNCSYIKEEHKKVFETANEISPEGHILMVAAITPMISGAVSKTVNLKSSATVADVARINLLAYTSGVKAIAIYRDGCKAAQPLSVGGNGEKSETDLASYQYKDLLKFAEGCRNAVPERLKPAGMRMSRTHSAKIGDIELYVTIGFYPDGKIAELFVSTDKEGTVVKGLLASLSKTISNMLQYNVPSKEIARLLRNQQFEPSGFVSRHPYIKSASSISDLLSKIIEIELGDFTHCQVKPDTFSTVANTLTSAKNLDNRVQIVDNTTYETQNSEKLYGEVCPICNSTNMFKNGTCKVCGDCGATTGCS
jgi:ribonucleoside-diphosphate reductase alpha chain